jgi:hypothetical protein
MKKDCRNRILRRILRRRRKNSPALDSLTIRYERYIVLLKGDVVSEGTTFPRQLNLGEAQASKSSRRSVDKK